MCSQKNVKRIIFSEECQKKFRTQKRIHKLKDPKLRKIRYELRTLLHLMYRKRSHEFWEELSIIREDKTLSYDQRREKMREIRKERERLQLRMSASPIGCVWCANQMEDLVFNPKRQCWICVTCYEDAHQQYPMEYP